MMFWWFIKLGFVDDWILQFEESIASKHPAGDEMIYEIFYCNDQRITECKIISTPNSWTAYKTIYRMIIKLVLWIF